MNCERLPICLSDMEWLWSWFRIYRCRCHISEDCGSSEWRSNYYQLCRKYISRRLLRLWFQMRTRDHPTKIFCSDTPFRCSVVFRTPLWGWWLWQFSFKSLKQLEPPLFFMAASSWLLAIFKQTLSSFQPFELRARDLWLFLNFYLHLLVSTKGLL
jgi:hypothetical protein